MTKYRHRDKMSLKDVSIFFVFALFLLFIWSVFLKVNQSSSMMFAFYIMTSYLINFCLFRKRFVYVTDILYLSSIFAALISIIDIASSALFSSTDMFSLSITDSLMKIFMFNVGGLFFFIFSRMFEMKTKIFFSEIGIIFRRFSAALVDFNVIILILGILAFFLGIVNTFELATIEENLIITTEIVVILLYKIIYEIRYSQTPGKMIADLKVRGSWFKIIFRNVNLILFGFLMFPLLRINTIFSSVIYFILFADIILMLAGKRLFDFIAGTEVMNRN